MNKLHSTQQKFNELVKQMDTLHLSEDGTLKGGILVPPPKESSNVQGADNKGCNNCFGYCKTGHSKAVS